MAHWVYINMENRSEVALFLNKVIVAYMCAAIGFFFYITLVPEVLLPGRFDIIGHSHQWWHAFTLVGFVWWFYCGLQLRDYRHEVPCEVSAKSIVS